VQDGRTRRQGVAGIERAREEQNAAVRRERRADGAHEPRRMLRRPIEETTQRHPRDLISTTCMGTSRHLHGGRL
jgi:hypothetical protein